MIMCFTVNCGNIYNHNSVKISKKAIRLTIQMYAFGSIYPTEFSSFVLKHKNDFKKYPEWENCVSGFSDFAYKQEIIAPLTSEMRSMGIDIASKAGVPDLSAIIVEDMSERICEGFMAADYLNEMTLSAKRILEGETSAFEKTQTYKCLTDYWTVGKMMDDFSMEPNNLLGGNPMLKFQNVCFLYVKWHFGTLLQQTV